MNNRNSALPLVLIVSLVSTAAADLVFDDGGQHTISDTHMDELVTIRSQTTVNLTGELRRVCNNCGGIGGIIPPPFVTVSESSHFTIDGGHLVSERGESSLLAGPALDIFSGSLVTMNNGKIDASQGVTLENSEIHMTGGEIMISSFEPTDGLSATASKVLISGGKIDSGSGAWATGIRLRESEGEMTGGLVVAFGETWISLDLSQSQFSFSDGQISGSVHVDNRSSFVMTGGEISAFREGITVTGGSETKITGGSVMVSSFDDQDARQLLEVDDAELTISGGIFGGQALGGLPPPQPPFSLHAWNSAQVTITGGDFQWTEHRGLLVESGADLVISGDGFNFPLFEPITATDGRITGTLLDGSPFDQKFERRGGTITLIPEPGSAVMFGLSAIGLLCLRRHRPDGKAVRECH